MAKSVLLQGATQDNHLVAVRNLLGIPNAEKVLLSVGFMNEGGLRALETALSPVAGETTILTGIRNGITSAQGLRKSLEIGCTTYVVDTGSRDVLFHPKVYLSRNATDAYLVIGSANLTAGGLSSNIEASIRMELELAEPENASFVEELEAKIEGMIGEYPQHVLQIIDIGMVQGLLDSGRVVDESVRPAPTTSGSSRSRDLDTIPKMNLHVVPIPRRRPTPFTRDPVPEDETIPEPPNPAGASAPVRERLTPVWQSNPLRRRHLNIPTGANTNQTGSMLFGKGAMDEIDQRHYFREEVFANLVWQFDDAPSTAHMERAHARFQIVIRDVNYGVFALRLSHNSRRNTAAYEQGNSMTQLHWGEARQIVAREDLLGRTMYLYRDGVDNGLFVLEID